MPTLRTRIASLFSRPRVDASALAPAPAPAPRVDGYIETVGEITGQPAYLYAPDARLDASMLAQVYEGDALAARIVDALPRDAMRSTWDLVQLDREYDWRSVQSRLDELKATQMITLAWTWARLYGGALLVMAIDDGRRPNEPVDVTKVRGILGLEVIESSRVRPSGIGVLRASVDPEHYEVTTIGGTTRTIHASRVIRFDSYRVPPERLRQNNGWAPSVLQRCWSSLCRYRAGQRDIAALSARMSVLVLLAKDWRKTAMATAEQKDKLRTYLRSLWGGMNAYNLLALDKDAEEIVEVKRSLEGVEAMQSTAVDAVVSDSGCPRLIITGEQTSTGLNSDSKGERRMWYDNCIAERKLVAEPALDELLALEFAARRNRGETVPSDWVTEWAPLEQEAAEDKASRATAWSGAITQLVAAGVITPEQGRLVLVGEGLLEQSELDAGKAAVVAAVLRKRIEGGMQPSGEPPPAAVAQDAAEPDLPTIYGWLVEHYSHARKLSAPRIQVLLGLREKHAFLRPPSAARLYRGLYNVSPARAGRLAGPTSPVRDKSWTTSPEVAHRFARGEFVKPEQLDASLLGVVMEAEADPEYMLLDAAAIADLPEVGGVVNEIWGMPLAESIREEAEVIVLGSLDVDQLRVLRYADH